jgi:ABC-2 type transport system ATP-binding protein
VNDANLAIEVKGLRKSYDALEAVAGIDLRVERGEVFALLGPNGAGKTTATEILEGHRTRSGGEVSVLGFDPGNSETAFKQRIGIVLQESGVDPYLTVEETLDLFRSYYPQPRPTEELLQLVGLEEQRNVRVLKLSGGQQRRLDVAVGLAGDPELLFLDEPTTGFDPAARHGAWEMVRDLQKLGKTIFLTTHYMEEAEVLANRVAIIRRGVIVAEGTPGSLVEKDPLTTIRYRTAEADGSLTAGIAGVGQRPDGVTEIKTSTPTATLAQLTGRAAERGIELAELTVTRPTLEDTYLRLVGEEGAAVE